MQSTNHPEHGAEQSEEDTEQQLSPARPAEPPENCFSKELDKDFVYHRGWVKLVWVA